MIGVFIISMIVSRILMLNELFARHLGSLEAVGNVSCGDFELMNTSLRRLERFWIDQVRFRL